ncbi:GNAT family N-acetyltransferase [bacterium]|nr:GNAT family N-acetyltransferase [bacterium]
MAGRKNISKLVKKVIVNKNGKRTTVWVLSNKADVLKYLGFSNPKDITPIKVNGKVVGGMDVTPNRGDKETLRVHKMMVLPEFQGKGIGGKAINKLLRDNPNVKQIIGNATAESKSFWQKVGAEFHSSEHTAFTIKQR